MADMIPRGCGVLPSMAPLANPYVPFQQYDPDVYTPVRAFARGTLFPGLDLPFLGMINKDRENMTPLEELQALHFAMHELGLYLDTHADDSDATELFAQYSDLYQEGLARYEAMYGPMCQKDAVVNGKYVWTQGPWPWEYAANKEG